MRGCACLRRVLASITLAYACAGHALATPEAVADVSLMAQARVVGPSVRLADVADITSEDTALRERLARVDLGPAPPSGAPVRLTREAIARWVTVKVSDAGRVRWRGAGVVQVDTRTQALAWGRLEALARSYLKEHLADEVGEMRLTPIDHGMAIDVPMGEISLAVRNLPARGIGAVMTVWIDIRVDDQPDKTVPVHFRVDGKRRVWVARTDQVPGVTVVPGAFELRDVPLDTVHRTPMSPEGLNQSALASARLRRTIRTGQVLGADDVESAPEVARGETAILTMTWGAVMVESPVEVLQDGRQGELIRVRPRTSTEPVLARVVGRGKLEISQ